MGDTGNGFDKNPQNINKKGAPKKEWTWAGLMTKLVEEVGENGIEVKETMVKAMIKRAEQGDVSAFKELSNRTDGMPKQAVDVTSKGEQIGGFDIIKPKIKNGEEEITIHTDDKTTSGLENPTG